VQIDGAVTTPLTLTVADLRALPQHKARVHYLSGTGSESHVFKGPLLADVLAKASPTFDPAVKNAGLRHVVSATGSDGYAAVVAWGEVDPAFAKRPVILATEQDGLGLDADGPRLVVPGDVRGGRYVGGVVHIELVDATAGG
jgi:DMSO/TMAO reductase YedYZ molybdopterin-dependent catalytic subunit